MKKMQGSEKQVAWATEIRQQYIAGGVKGATTGTSAFRTYASEKMKSVGITQADLMPCRDELMALIPIAFESVCRNDSAVWWIENRACLDNALAAEWVKMICAKLGKEQEK